MAYVTHYIRARHYSQIGATWTTRDPLWPNEMPYGYVNGRVIRSVDYSGEFPSGQTQVGAKTKPAWVPRPSNPPNLVSTVSSEQECGEGPHGEIDQLSDLFKFIKLASVVGLIFTPNTTASYEPDVLWQEQAMNLDKLFDNMETIDGYSKKCKNIWNDKTSWCGKNRKCRAGDTCEVIRGNYYNGHNCAQARYLAMDKCGKKNNKDWMCKHIAEFCNVLSVAQNCAVLSNKRCGGFLSEFPQSEFDCKKFAIACKGAKSLSGNTLTFPNWK